MAAPDEPDRKHRWFLPTAVAFLVLAVIAGAMMVVFGPPDEPLAGPRGSDPVVASSAVPEGPALLVDDLDRDRLWLAKTEPDGRSSCTFAGGELHARIEARPLYKCRGPQDNLPTNLSIDTDVRLLTEHSCAAMWFRFKLPRGYLVRICRNNIFVGTHKSSEVAVSRTLPLDNPIQVGGPAVRIGLRITGETVTVTRDGVPVGDAPLGDAEITGRRVLLGVYPDRDAPEDAPAEVTFDHIAIHGPSVR
jgi:hypothetical protein